MSKEREGHLEVVVEIDGKTQPILTQVDIDSDFSLRSSLAHALCLPKAVEGPLMIWDRESRLPDPTDECTLLYFNIGSLRISAFSTFLLASVVMLHFSLYKLDKIV